MSTDQLRVPIVLDARGPGPACCAPDKAYSSCAHRATLRASAIQAVIPERADQVAHRTARGSRGGRPVSCDVDEYKGRNGVERGINVTKQW